jgi:hypothetical protein
MRLLAVALLIVLCFTTVSAQKRATVVAKGETYLEGVLPNDMLYAFDEFREATLIRKDGVENKTRININLFSGDILFLSAGNQVLVLAYPDDLDRIVIDKSVWLPIENSYGEVLNADDKYSLIRLKKTRITDTRRESGFGGMSSTTSTKAVTAFTPDNHGQVALPLGEYDFETASTYRLIAGTQKVIADAKGFRKVFSDKKKEINSYLKANPVDFKNETEIMEFMKKCIEM